MAILGIDYGAKRIGLATGSVESKLATPLETIPNNPTLIERLKAIIQRERIEQVVVGLPRGLDGQRTAQTQVVIEFIKELERQLQLSVIQVDEAVTSELAKEKLGKNAKVEDIDMHAAAIILQDYLDEGSRG